MLSFPKYESYQSTEEDWLGDIPLHWQLLRTKSIFRLVAEPAPKNNDEELLSVYSDIGVKPRRELEERGNKASTTDGYWLVKKGDIIVNKLLAWMGAIGLSEYDGVTSPAYDILRAYKPINSKFYHYLFRNPICINKLKKHSKGIMEMRLRLYFDEFGNIKIPYPPLEDQNRIVDFLDRKTAEIDQAIEQKQRLIKLLKEQKAILIDRAVTKGLNPNVPICDSGVDWIGEIPKHWNISKIGFVASVTKLTGFEYTSFWKTDEDGEIIALRGFNIGERTLNLENTEKINSSLSYRLKRSRLRKGDLVVPCTGTLGNASVIDSDEKYHINQNIAKITIEDTSILPSFLCYWMTSNLFRKKIDRDNVSGMQPVLLIGSIRKLAVVLPSIEEQKLIIEQLDMKTQGFDALINKERQIIEILMELKSIMVSNAVAGKIKI